ncbi:hypothetical protein SAMN05421812_103593 [Asanoa hainanensis]|uniref:Uncharacterized protein n=1 Tax=Asanoa hainanensis TaxID=560556 RepID=A0A239KJT8_9ACTN|nr:hypothetical protein SAMN05421812_103593 [Asanoa hainanensis]
MHDNDGLPQRESTTNWQAHDTPSMWRMIESQQTDAQWRHVSGLRRMAELTATHLGRLQRYRDGLAEAWPPERSKASQAFISRLDYLIEHVRSTHEVAAANYTTVSTATAAVEATRSDMAKLHAEYLAKLKAVRTYEALVQAEQTSQLPGTTIGPPPTTQLDLEAVNARARSVMSGLSTTLVLAHVQLRRPTPYQHRAVIEGGPPIPVIITRTASTGVQAVQAVRTPDTGATNVRRPEGDAMNHGPTPRDLIPSNPHPASEANGSRGAVIAGSGPATRASRPETGQRKDYLRAAGATPTSALNANPGSTVPRPERSVAGSGLIAPSGAGARDPERVNPVGGVIGTPQSGSHLASHPGTGQGPSSQSTRSNTRKDLGEPWQINEGGPAVVMPPAVAAGFDPGPAIGIDK